jgi:beta-lactamase regulating signal transducer with metallopeptidase domain
MIDAHFVDGIIPALACSAAVSVISGLCIGVADRRLSALHPERHLRWVNAAIWMPALLSTLFFMGACLDYWMARLITVSLPLSLPSISNRSISVSIVVCAIGAYVAAGVIRIVRSARSSGSALIDLRGLALTESDEYVLIPVDAPCAFVLGLVHPRVIVSRGLKSCLNRRELNIVLAHERAHARRRDPLRQLVASVGLLWHVPGISDFLRARLRLCQELIADRAAVGDGADERRVAATLLRFARLQARAPAAAIAFGNSEITRRVRSLIDARPPAASGYETLYILLVLSLSAGALILGRDLHSTLHHLAAALNQLP